MNSKGSLGDALYIALGVIFLAIVSIPVYIFITQANDVVQGIEGTPQGFKDNSSNLQSNFPLMYQTWFLFFLGGSWLITLILAFSVNIRPAWFAASFFIMLAIIFVAVLGANAYDDAVRQQFAEAANFGVINFVMGNMGKLGVSMVMSVGVALYAKSKL